MKLNDLPLVQRRNLYFQQDGASARNTRRVQNYLNVNFTQNWIGRHDPIRCPARSPDLNLFNFFLWPHIQHIIYQNEIHTVNELRDRIVQACSVNESRYYFKYLKISA